MLALFVISAILWSGVQSGAAPWVTENPNPSKYPNLPPGGPRVSLEQVQPQEIGKADSCQLPPPYMLDNQGNTFHQVIRLYTVVLAKSSRSTKKISW